LVFDEKSPERAPDASKGTEDTPYNPAGILAEGAETTSAIKERLLNFQDSKKLETQQIETLTSRLTIKESKEIAELLVMYIGERLFNPNIPENKNKFDQFMLKSREAVERYKNSGIDPGFAKEIPGVPSLDPGFAKEIPDVPSLDPGFVKEIPDVPSLDPGISLELPNFAMQKLLKDLVKIVKEIDPEGKHTFESLMRPATEMALDNTKKMKPSDLMSQDQINTRIKTLNKVLEILQEEDKIELK